MDPSGSLLLSTAPPWITEASDGGDGGPLDGVPQRWRDHWKQCWVPLIPPRGRGPLQVVKGSSVRLRVAHDAISVSVGLSHSVEEAPSPQPSSSLATLVLWNSPMRMWQMSDLPSRWGPLCASIVHHLGLLTTMIRDEVSLRPPEGLEEAERAPKDVRSPASGSHERNVHNISPDGLLDIVTLGDGPTLPLMVAAACNAYFDKTKSPWDADNGVRGSDSPRGSDRRTGPVVSLTAAQDTGLGLSSKWARVAQEREASRCCSMGFEQSHHYFERICSSQALPTKDRRPLLVVAEPYYRDLEGQLPWYGLRFWRQLQTIR